MIFSLQTSTEEQQRAFASPGLYLRTPAPETYAITPNPVGLAGFIGYARRRPTSGANASTDDAARLPDWPLMLTSLEQAQQQLQVPGWGLLMPSLALFFANGGRRCLVVGISPEEGHSVERLLPDDPERAQGLPAFDRVGGLELLLAPDLFVVPPGQTPPPLDGIIRLQHCLIDFAAGQVKSSELGGGLALLDVPPGLTGPQLLTYASLVQLHPLASFGALYGPWVLKPVEVPAAQLPIPWVEVQGGAQGSAQGAAASPGGRTLLPLPATGAIAGLISSLSTPPPDSALPPVSTDFGPHQSPANRRIEGIFGIERAGLPLVKDQRSREALLQGSLNLVVPRSGDGFRLWGDRTLSSEAMLRQITVRRVLSFIQRSIYLSSRWAVFEPNTWTLWLQLTAQVEIFLEGLYNAGVIVGSSPDDAFFVKCDSDTNPPEAVEEGRITMLIYVRPARSTELMVVEIIHRGADISGDAAGTGPATKSAPGTAPK